MSSLGVFEFCCIAATLIGSFGLVFVFYCCSVVSPVIQDDSSN